jgi:TRAP-type C4-dicarboxylate transport system substrate-binding protein
MEAREAMMRQLAGWTAATVLAGGVMLGAAPPAAAETVTLRVGNWLPMHHLIVRGIVEPWARAIEAETDGGLQFDTMTSGLGPPPTYFDLLIDGAIDVGYGVSGHNPGRFTMTQVMDLPFMSPDPWSGAAASWLTYQRYGELYGEHEGAHVVGLWVHSIPYIHMRGDPILSLDDLEGKRIRVGGNVTGRIVSQLGGTPVQVPPTEAQQAMARGVADGITFPMESVPFFGITPVIENTTAIPGGLYTDTFWLAFNQETWDGLSDEHKAAIEKHSGMAVALLSGWAWTNGDELGFEQMQEHGVTIHTLPEEEVERIRAQLADLEEEWLAEAGSRGLPGEEILAYAREMVERYRAEKVVNVL